MSRSFDTIYARSGTIANASIGPVGLVTNEATTAAVYDNQNPQAVYVESENTTFTTSRGVSGKSICDLVRS